VPRLLVHFARFGPYHLARIDAAAAVLRPLGWEVGGLETGGSDVTYAWREEESADRAWQRHTVFPGEAAERIPASRLGAGIAAALDRLKPDAVAIAGWGSPDARACLAWCRKHGAKAIVMSETREADGRRVGWKEFLKSRIIRRFDAALVGGKSHRDYLVKLGLPADRIRFGYNVVDNKYFAEECLKVGKSKVEGQDTPPYFLTSNRFIERKNLARLVAAYASYVQQSTIDDRPSTIWPLCLLGDGELKAALIAQCQALGLNVIESAPWEQLPPSTIHHSQSTIVYLPGFRQIEELPQFYAHAGCFVHPALEEPWGLVLNEAMACSLPVLSGNNVGAAEELIDEGLNGWTFNAGDTAAMAAALRKIAGQSEAQRLAMGTASTRILDERCPTAAFGQGLAELLQQLPL
jgi:1,2-diacylglycerol 3-alpha-glucosyltransferase